VLGTRLGEQGEPRRRGLGRLGALAPVAESRVFWSVERSISA